MKRNGYIDVIKFIFAIIIAEFHFGSGIFLGGRMAVEGFFIITGYLMMKTIEKSPVAEKGIGISSVEFIFKKYKSLFYYLLPSVILSFIVIAIYREYTLIQALKKIPLLLFEIIPLNSTGLKGEYVIGISWYLSSMFIALAILYPLCRRLGKGFTLIGCPLIVVFGYGTLSHYFGHLAVNYQYIGNTIINTGIIRGFAGCALGCLMYEASALVAKKPPKAVVRVILTIVEILAFAYFVYCMHYYPKTVYDYASIFAIFTFLFIGINGLSYTSYLWNPKWTKPLGTASTLIVLSHYCWVIYLKKVLPAGYQRTPQALWFVLAVIVSSIVVYLCARLLKLALSKLGKPTTPKIN